MWTLALLTALTSSPVLAGAGEDVPVDAGDIERFYPVQGEPRAVRVEAFALDTDLVSNSEFLAFVRQHPQWRRDRVASLFADPGYLAHWRAPDSVGVHGDKPVVRVSWFAARAYCASVGKRLPTEIEWERAAMASASTADASGDPERTQRLLAWYARPATAELPPVGSGTPNVWGVRDLHGVVWEWVEDFNSSFAAADSRAGDDPDTLRFCGSGAVSAADASDYASFMRLAFRSSLEGPYTARTLGFRCARDLDRSIP